jgi:hypothetical protein
MNGAVARGQDLMMLPGDTVESIVVSRTKPNEKGTVVRGTSFKPCSK